jgi:hypothetical protein
MAWCLVKHRENITFTTQTEIRSHKLFGFDDILAVIDMSVVANLINNAAMGHISLYFFK